MMTLKIELENAVRVSLGNCSGYVKYVELDEYQEDPTDQDHPDVLDNVDIAERIMLAFAANLGFTVSRDDDKKALTAYPKATSGKISWVGYTTTSEGIVSPIMEEWTLDNLKACAKQAGYSGVHVTEQPYDEKVLPVYAKAEGGKINWVGYITTPFGVTNVMTNRSLDGLKASAKQAGFSKVHITGCP